MIIHRNPVNRIPIRRFVAISQASKIIALFWWSHCYLRCFAQCQKCRVTGRTDALKCIHVFKCILVCRVALRICIALCAVGDCRILCAEHRSCNGCDPGCLFDAGSRLFSAPEAGYFFQKTGK